VSSGQDDHVGRDADRDTATVGGAGPRGDATFVEVFGLDDGAVVGEPIDGAAGAALLVSFDIDGTLEVGDPAGPIPLAFVRWVQGRGWLVGSCSDRTMREQSEMWARAGIVPDFVSAKHRLLRVREAFESDRFVHIGDTRMDAYFAEQAGFEFLHIAEFPAP
jgi:hypothetical protein